LNQGIGQYFTAMNLLWEKSKNMKRIVSFILSAVFFISLVGCSSHRGTDGDVLAGNSEAVDEVKVQKSDDTDTVLQPVYNDDSDGKEAEETLQSFSSTYISNEVENETDDKADNDVTIGKEEKDTDSENKNAIGADVDSEKVKGDKAGQKEEGSKSTIKEENKGGAKVQKHDLVELIKLDDSFVIDIKYATEDNFAKKKIYSMPLCLIHKNTAQKLIAANNEFKTLGYRIKVFDAYRPYSVQQILWDAAEDKSYLANPKKGSKHNRGAAVDITLVDENGKELPMPSGYDEFSERAHIKYNQCDEQLIRNRELLGEIMVKHGFKRISTEWWHFDDTDALNYPLLDVSFEEFLQENQN